MAADPQPPTEMEERDDPRITRILDLIDEASRPRPADEVLAVLCVEVAGIVRAPVASLYVRDEEDDGALVIRANVGLASAAVGTRLRVGEGLTGFAAECMRPVTVDAAPVDAHYKPVPGLGEESFPSFLALPILVGRRSEAVLVMQRRAGDVFSDAEVVLATALASSFAYALERARAREEARVPKKAWLTARPRTTGAALGRVETLPDLRGLAALARRQGLGPADPEALLGELDRLTRDLRRYASKLALPPEVSGALETVLLAGEDQRLRALLRSAEEPNPVSAVASVAKVVARAPYDVGADPSSTTRASEIESLLLTLASRLVDVRVPNQGGVLLLTEHLSGLTALLAVAHRATALAVSGSLAEDGLGVRVARAAGLPVVDRVGGLFAWAHAGDRVVVDADEGVVRVNPSATTMARYRRQK
ncbi:MAG: GAF domain-containing protein [Sandaracinaceae bacterium]